MAIHLGGKDFDSRIINYRIDRFKSSNGIDLRKSKGYATDQGCVPKK